MKKDMITELLTRACFNLVHSGLGYAFKNVKHLNNILNNHQSKKALSDINLAMSTDNQENRNIEVNDAVYNLVRISNNYQFDLTKLV